MEPFGFDKMPEILRQLFEKVERIEATLDKIIILKQETDNPLSIEEAASYLNVTKAALYSMTSRRLIPFSKPGKRVYFLKKDLDTWVNQAKINTRAQPTSEIRKRFYS